ncbi:MAG: hypothetical protein WD851_14890 [Pirellulales bacterium]
MRLNWKAYAVLAGVFVLSIGTFLLLPDNHELLRGVIAAPGVTALLAALFQLMRDEADYEKRLDAQRREFQFTLGAASHMANAAFDKHAEFCEKYMKKLHEAVRTLFREGDTPAALDHAGKLYSLRQDYATWLTDRINSDLDEFESALRKLGADAGFIRSTTGHEGYAEQRALRIDRNFELFNRILGLKSSDNIQEKSMVEALKTKVRAILRVEELTKLREHLIEQASNAIGA